MKIDKIAFACSELFSPFWDVQSKIWKTKFNIHPVCFLYGSKKKCNLSEEYGDVVELDFISGIPDIIQLQFSKFYYPSLEPNTTWITGDIDLIPLQTEYFLYGLDKVSEDSYVHLNHSFCGRIWERNPTDFFTRGSRLTGGFDLPAHYHVAKGRLFHELFFSKHENYKSFIEHIVSSGRYGMIGSFTKKEDVTIRGNYWVAEETYTSEVLWDYYRPRNFVGFLTRDNDPLTSRIEIKYGGAHRIFPSVWKDGNIQYDRDKIRRKEYVEIHCGLPYEQYDVAMRKLLSDTGMI